MRIIAGDKRGAKLQTPDNAFIRPTGDRARQALFNILAHAAWAPPLFTSATAVADLFCGTGALALEALSRGCGQAVLIDSSREALTLAERNAIHLGYKNRCRFLPADAARLPAATHPVHLAFLDPPYNQGLVTPSLERLAAGGWLAPGAVVVAECEKNEAPTLPPGFSLADSRRYGVAKFLFMVYQ